MDQETKSRHAVHPDSISTGALAPNKTGSMCPLGSAPDVMLQTAAPATAGGAFYGQVKLALSGDVPLEPACSQ